MTKTFRHCVYGSDCVKACASLVVEGTDEEDLAEHCVYGPDCVKACASLVVEGTDEEDLAEHCVYGPAQS